MLLRDHPILENRQNKIILMLYGENELFEGLVGELLDISKYKKLFDYEVDVTEIRNFGEKIIIGINPPKEYIKIKVDKRVANFIKNYGDGGIAEYTKEALLEKIAVEIEDYIFSNYLWE